MSPESPTLTEYERQCYSPASQRGLLAVRALTDDQLLSLASGDGSALARGVGDQPATAAYVTVVAATGPGTNPSWVTSCAAEVAYDRCLIDEDELSWWTR